MIDDSLLQWDSDIVIEQEREESMETDVLLDSAAPVPLKEKAMSEDFEARDPDDCCSHTCQKRVPTKTHPTTLIPMRMSFWGL